LDENSTQLIKRYFKEYYFRNSARIKAPSDIERREFGYMPFGGMMVRHLSFKEIGTFRALMVKEAPAGVYSSNSHYEEPSAEMHLKDWQRAELIFDIDSDSLKQPCRKVHDMWLCKGCGKKEFGLRPEVCPSCKANRILELPWACRQCIDAAKKETLRLLDFLEFDFGISTLEIKVYFSGNAGYHINVESSAYDTLDVHGRAEIADYLAGRGLTSTVLSSPRLLPSDPGWRGRIARYIRDIPDEDTAFRKSGSLFEKRIYEITNLFSKKELESFTIRVINDNCVRIDAMVTTDVHRIFRMPETLNNKTGLVKRECEKDLTSFDPLEEAIAIKDDENDQRARVFVEMSPRIELGGRPYGPFQSETVDLPIYVAVYLIAKGAAKSLAPQAKQPELPLQKK
jgi:DNA primase small subunit